MCDLCDAEARRVIFEGKVEFGIVEFEAAEAVGVGEFAEGAELIVSEGRLEFEFGFEERHGGSIARERGLRKAVDLMKERSGF